MPVVPNAVERLALLRLNLGPGVLLDVLPQASFRAVHAALELGVLEAVADGPRTPGEVARATGCSERGMALLLGGLEAGGYVQGRRGGYVATPLTSKWLLRRSPTCVADAVRFYHEVVFPFWDEALIPAVKAGQPPQDIYAWMDQRPGLWAKAQAGFLAMGRLAVDEVVAKAGLPERGRLLDAGGGHGLYAARLLKARPGWTATVLDRAAALEPAHQVAKEEGVADRLALRPGDYLRDPLGEGYDAAFLFNIVHGHSPEENAQLLRRLAKALKPGGRLVVLDQFPGRAPGPAMEAFARLFPLGLNYFVALGQQPHGAEELGRWLAAAGFGSPRRVGLRTAPGSALLLAERRA